MPTYPSRLHYLLERYAAGDCTKKELLELFRIIDESHQDETLHDSLQTIWNDITDTDALPAIDKEKIFSSIISTAPVHTIPHKRSVRWRAAAAAVVFILLTGGMAYVYYANRASQKMAGIAQHETKNDRAPGGNKAILTLADGASIVLDSANNGDLTQQGNTKVIKLDNGRLAYQSEKTGAQYSTTPIQYNTITTPRGGQYQIALPDGTKVWLNAASSLKFPTAFTGKERNVELAGEAYFEVAKNAGAPFKVHIIRHSMALSHEGREDNLGREDASGGDVEVLGTQFNINAYDDESTVKTTLLEGSVKVSKGKDHNLLKPGQQTQLDAKGAIHVLSDVNTEEVIAWKNGYFQFDDADIRTVMRQLARWYDVEISYEGPVTERQFGGQMPRGVSLSEVLRILEASNVHFRVEGKKLVVAP